MSTKVLCVDLDGSLIASDLVWECLTALLKINPFLLLLVPVWFLRGRAAGKRRLAEAAHLNPEALPYRREVLDYLQQQKNAGRRLVLITAADETLAYAVAQHLGVFESVLGSNGRTNLKGGAKARRLVGEFGTGGYSYLGDSPSDLRVWSSAATALVVGPSARLARKAATLAPIEKRFLTRRPGLRTMLRCLRMHHWAKNLLIFLPMLLAHRVRVAKAVSCGEAFLLFGIAASSIYVINDLLDLSSDRQHPWKCKRPFASGAVPLWSGFLMFVVLFSTALGLGFKLLGPAFSAITAIYCAVVFLYSLRLKKEPLLDVFVLSSFYVFRIVLGGVMAAVPLSKWFLIWSSFFFFSLALSKRYSELVHAEELVHPGDSGRGYRTGDREVIGILGLGSALCSVVIFSLYAQSREVLALYEHPGILLLVAPVVLYWLARVWLRAHRGELQEDPITLALTDRVSYYLGAVILLIVGVSMLLN